MSIGKGPFKFGAKSTRELATCHPDIQRVFNEVIKHVDCSILEGHRPEGRQNMLFDQGKSKLRWPNGKHNSKPSRAVDAMPYFHDIKNISWERLEELRAFAYFVLGVAAAMGIKMRWGGDWNSNLKSSDERFYDGPHFELL